MFCDPGFSSRSSEPTEGKSRQPRSADSIAATLIFFMLIIASNARFASSPPAASASVSTRRDLPANTPLVFTPAARTFLTAIADDGIPVAVGLVLIVGGDLEREGFVVSERGTAV